MSSYVIPVFPAASRVPPRDALAARLLELEGSLSWLTPGVLDQLEAAAGKADRASPAVAGRLAALDASGNPVDSGKSPSDFAPASGIARSALDASVRASLGKADTALQEHQSLAAYVNGGAYDSDARKILLKHGSTTIAEIDATAFIKDGMVDSVEVSGGNLVISFNTDAGIEDIELPLTDIFNPANYYNRTEANDTFVKKENGKGLFSGSYNDLSDKPAPVDVSGKVDGNAVYPEWLASPPNPYPGNAIVSHNGHFYQLGEEYAGTDSEPGVSEEWDDVQLGDLKQDALSPAQLANIAAVPGKANAGDIPSASSAAPLMDGAASAGSPGAGYSLGDHVHPIDTSRQAKITASGLLKGNGSGGVTAAVPGTDYQAPLTSEQITNINAVPSKAPIASPELTGTPTAPTAPSGTNTTQVATTAFVHNAVSDKANASDVAAALVQKLDGAAAYPAWVDGGAYAVDDVVTHNGRIWKSLVTNFDEPGTDPTKWHEVLVGDLIDGKQDALSSAQLDNIAAVPGKMPMYPMVAVTPSNGTLTVVPYTVATYTAGTTAAAFTVAVGAGTTGTARDCELVIDCTATGAVAPTVTWPSNFHPRTDAATDFACEAGVRNVYYISEYATGEFAVGGWQETTGGNA